MGDDDIELEASDADMAERMVRHQVKYSCPPYRPTSTLIRNRCICVFTIGRKLCGGSCSRRTLPSVSGSGESQLRATAVLTMVLTMVRSHSRRLPHQPVAHRPVAEWQSLMTAAALVTAQPKETCVIHNLAHRPINDAIGHKACGHCSHCSHCSYCSHYRHSSYCSY